MNPNTFFSLPTAFPLFSFSKVNYLTDCKKPRKKNYKKGSKQAKAKAKRKQKRIARRINRRG
jgi:hypothetical protein